jgi:hypothetical protein
LGYFFDLGVLGKMRPTVTNTIIAEALSFCAPLVGIAGEQRRLREIADRKSDATRPLLPYRAAQRTVAGVVLRWPLGTCHPPWIGPPMRQSRERPHRPAAQAIGRLQVVQRLAHQGLDRAVVLGSEQLHRPADSGAKWAPIWRLPTLEGLASTAVVGLRASDSRRFPFPSRREVPKVIL